MSPGDERPYCYGVLENVFPMGDNGLRNTPESCFACIYKTECLRTAMRGREGLKVKTESVDRAYASGIIGFLDRWSQRKKLHHQIQGSRKK